MAELLGRRRRRRHLEAQVDILAGKLYLEFSNWNFTHMRALGILMPGFSTEFQAGSIYHSDLAWGAILEKQKSLISIPPNKSWLWGQIEIRNVDKTTANMFK